MSSSEPMPTFHPRRLLVWASILSVVLVAGSLIGWFALGPEVRADFTGPQVATLALFVLFLVVVMFALGLSRVKATDAGLDVRNAFSRKVHPWESIDSIRFAPGDPWAFLVLSTAGTGRAHDDGERRPLLGIQASDGARSQVMAERLRTEISARRGTGSKLR